MVNGTRDKWFKQFVNPTKSVFQILSTRLYSPDIPETVKLKIAVKSNGNESKGSGTGPETDVSNWMLLALERLIGG